SSTPISIPHTYNDPKSSVSSHEESEEKEPLVDDKNDEFLGVFSSEESTDEEYSWFEELKLKSRKNAARNFLGEEEETQSNADDQGESSFTLKSKLAFHDIKHLPLSPISPFVLDPAKKELSESEDF
ncbi:MAG TPA: hypothetical protein DCE71_01230, partial [Parachlamydiales bacterium]|nr:hypothetical protein [Parachlamydiales bacterium]